MKKCLSIFVFTLLFVSFSADANTRLRRSSKAPVSIIGKPAFNFELKDMDGKMRKLSDYTDKGKWVVLEWLNPDCPFVKKHYDSGNMQKIQAEYTKKGVIWLSINSSAAGKEGHLTQSTATAFWRKSKSRATTILLDPEGQTAKYYQAKVTPHMFIVNPKRELAYKGAIDNDPYPEFPNDKKERSKVVNYVEKGLEEALNNRIISTDTTRPYGC